MCRKASLYLIHHCGLDIHKGEIVGFVVKSSCEYLAPIAFPDELEVGVRVDRLGNSSVQITGRLRDGLERILMADSRG